MTGDNGSLISRVFELSSLTAYQEGSIVSRTLIDKKVGTVTMFAFGAGQGLSEHTAPFDAMIIVVDGQAEVTIGDEPYSVVTGEMLVMPANIPHAVTAVDDFKMMLVMIRDQKEGMAPSNGLEPLTL